MNQDVPLIHHPAPWNLWMLRPHGVANSIGSFSNHSQPVCDQLPKILIPGPLLVADSLHGRQDSPDGVRDVPQTCRISPFRPHTPLGVWSECFASGMDCAALSSRRDLPAARTIQPALPACLR